MNNIRLSYYDLHAIKLLFRKYFLPNDGLWVFGSRTDPNRKGGDIDLYVETNADTTDEAIKMKLSFLSSLEEEIGEQKTDLVLNMIKAPHHLLIYDVAKNNGIKII